MNMTKEVIAASENDRNILILGSAGTGKSNLLKKTEKHVQLTGTTGIASSLLHGMTIH